MGNVVIIYKADGAKTSDPQNWIIPDDGILKTNYKFFAGNYVTNYYQKNSINSYDTLRYDFTVKDTTKNEIVFPRTLTFSKYKSKEIFTVTTFYVGKKTAEELAKDRFFFERKLEKMLLGEQ
ncbi:MAG TPA: hypothetical protein DDY18_11370 [Flavobacterium sp.]|nr:hypothetical protein [Flavobacterium sp.]